MQDVFSEYEKHASRNIQLQNRIGEYLRKKKVGHILTCDLTSKARSFHLRHERDSIEGVSPSYVVNEMYHTHDGNLALSIHQATSLRK